MQLDSSFYQEEIRSGFLVSEKMKRIWAVELAILEKFDQVCRKYNLTYYVFYGTLLGVVRHQGFIPWDNDVDVIMFRDDYEKFQTIAPQEFQDPYFFQTSYNDNEIRMHSKIRDSRTTAVESLDVDLNQGIYIDIFPFDDVPDGEDPVLDHVCNIQATLWYTIVAPQMVYDYLQQGKVLALSRDVLLDLLHMDIRQRFKELELFNLSHFGHSKVVNFLFHAINSCGPPPFKKEWFQKVEYLPFESLMVPVPAAYDEILTYIYGDYHIFVKGASIHENQIQDPDISYKEFMLKMDPEQLKAMLKI